MIRVQLCGNFCGARFDIETVADVAASQALSPPRLRRRDLGGDVGVSCNRARRRRQDEAEARS
jgi:hypothetical protein